MHMLIPRRISQPEPGRPLVMQTTIVQQPHLVIGRQNVLARLIQPCHFLWPQQGARGYERPSFEVQQLAQFLELALTSAHFFSH